MIENCEGSFDDDGDNLSVISEMDIQTDLQFAEPSTKRKKFKLRRQKKCNDGDNVSVISFDVSMLQGSSTKRKRRLSRVTSFASLLSPASPVRKVGAAIQRSWSSIMLSHPPSPRPTTCSRLNGQLGTSGLCSNQFLPSSLPLQDENKNVKRIDEQTICNSPSISKRASSTFMKHRTSRLWIETLSFAHAEEMRNKLSRQEIQRQEAIFELLQGEKDLAEDLHLIQQTYHDSLFHLGILQPEELRQIFGPLHTLMPLHEDLSKKISDLKQDDLTINSIGPVLMDWVPRLEAYILYCSNLVRARTLLEEKKSTDKRLEDFLQRCLQSSFSRKLDLWTFLDVPRCRLVKYPLLLQTIIKYTPKDHEDRDVLLKAKMQAEEIIQIVDKKTGEANCQFILESLDFIEDFQRDSFISEATALLCSGVLRNNRGTKLHAFLFNTGLVLTRCVTRWNNNPSPKAVFQVYRQPISANQLQIEDLKDGEVKFGGSFRSAFSYGHLARNIFRVSFLDENLGQAHTLQANDEHDKKQWLQNLYQVSTVSHNLPEDLDDGGFLKRPKNLSIIQPSKLSVDKWIPSDKENIQTENDQSFYQ